MENRLSWVLILIVLLAFLQIGEMFFEGQAVEVVYEGKEYPDLQGLSGEEIADKYDQELKDLSNQLNNGEIGLQEFLNRKNQIDEKYHPFQNPELLNTYSNTNNNIFVDAFTLNIPNAPDLINIILAIFNSVILMITIFISASVIYDVIKGLPLT